ncbi:unnamed protein product [Durusdinium trenchii]|uniref:Calcineurin-like phosphoesterase domain-containing protein n=1 Tax=Durusdinium trenchii TaxID=1381693 RepID=A0ABP0M4R8_9DINO
MWEVVGGGEKGGLVVREGQSLSSTQLEERLPTGALVREVKLESERLCYELISRTGPATGWVSLSLKGRPLLVNYKDWPPQLQQVYRHSKELLPSLPWPQLACQRLVAWSDLHIDMGENMRHLEGMAGDQEAALIVAGDVCTNLDILEKALKLCQARFKVVFYVPGNHELWVVKEAAGSSRPQQTSLQKFNEILALCARLGVFTHPAFIAPGVAVCPLFSWYRGDFSGSFVHHKGFDTSTYWPEMESEDAHDPQVPWIAEFFLRLNQTRVAQASVLQETGKLQTLWTFSHFLPRKELNLSGAHHVMMPGTCGDVQLERQIRTAHAIGHVYGHSHVGQDRVYEGIRYLQQPMGYPSDGHREERPLQIWAETDEVPRCLSSSGSQLVAPPVLHLDADRVRGALWGALIGDALSMPVCWYYGGPLQIKRDYGGPLTGYVKPKQNLPGSFMKDEVIPEKIDHGRSKFWTVEEKNPKMGFHYHYGLDAGEHTLEGYIFRLYLAAVVGAKGVVQEAAGTLQEDYMAFMEARGPQHRAPWLCLYHRLFFRRLDDGWPPTRCAQSRDPKELAETLDALSGAVPAVLAATKLEEAEAEKQVAKCIQCIRSYTPEIAKYVKLLSLAFRLLLQPDGTDGRPPPRLDAVAERLNVELRGARGGATRLAELLVGRKDPMTSTSLEEGFPSILHYMFRYHDSFPALLLAQANAGGECVHRGTLLGALAGAAHGMKGIPAEWLSGLVERQKIKEEIEAYVAALCH